MGAEHDYEHRYIGCRKLRPVGDFIKNGGNRTAAETGLNQQMCEDFRGTAKSGLREMYECAGRAFAVALADGGPDSICAARRILENGYEAQKHIHDSHNANLTGARQNSEQILCRIARGEIPVAASPCTLADKMLTKTVRDHIICTVGIAVRKEVILSGLPHALATARSQTLTQSVDTTPIVRSILEPEGKKLRAHSGRERGNKGGSTSLLAKRK